MLSDTKRVRLPQRDESKFGSRLKDAPTFSVGHASNRKVENNSTYIFFFWLKEVHTYIVKY